MPVVVFEVVLGIALWCLAALMLLYAAIAAMFDPRELWARRKIIPIIASA